MSGAPKELTLQLAETTKKLMGTLGSKFESDIPGGVHAMAGEVLEVKPNTAALRLSHLEYFGLATIERLAPKGRGSTQVRSVTFNDHAFDTATEVETDHEIKCCEAAAKSARRAVVDTRPAALKRPLRGSTEWYRQHRHLQLQ